MAANTANAPPPSVMMSIGDLAARDGVSKPTVSIAVKRLIERHGLTVERDGRGRVAKVNAAQYDHLRDRFGDAHHAQAPARPPADAPPFPPPLADKANDSLDEAQRQKAWIDAERARINLAEQKGELLRTAAMVDAIGECGIEIARILDRLPNASDDLAAAVGRDGAHGVRVELKNLARKMRADIAEALAAIAGAAPELEQETPATAAAAA